VAYKPCFVDAYRSGIRGGGAVHVAQGACQPLRQRAGGAAAQGSIRIVAPVLPVAGNHPRQRSSRRTRQQVFQQVCIAAAKCARWWQRGRLPHSDGQRCCCSCRCGRHFSTSTRGRRWHHDIASRRRRRRRRRRQLPIVKHELPAGISRFTATPHFAPSTFTASLAVAAVAAAAAVGPPPTALTAAVIPTIIVATPAFLGNGCHVRQPACATATTGILPQPPMAAAQLARGCHRYRQAVNIHDGGSGRCRHGRWGLGFRLRRCRLLRLLRHVNLRINVPPCRPPAAL